MADDTSFNEQQYRAALNKRRYSRNTPRESGDTPTGREDRDASGADKNAKGDMQSTNTKNNPAGLRNRLQLAQNRGSNKGGENPLIRETRQRVAGYIGLAGGNLVLPGLGSALKYPLSWLAGTKAGKWAMWLLILLVLAYIFLVFIAIMAVVSSACGWTVWTASFVSDYADAIQQVCGAVAK